MPDVDFDAWFAWLLVSPDPLKEVQAVRAFSGDPKVDEALGRHLRLNGNGFFKYPMERQSCHY